MSAGCIVYGKVIVSVSLGTRYGAASQGKKHDRYKRNETRHAVKSRILWQDDFWVGL